MSLTGNNILGGASGQTTGYDIDQSLRFDDGDSPKLTRTPSSAGNRKTWTWSGWVKRGNLDVTPVLLSSVESSARQWFGFYQNNIYIAHTNNAGQIRSDAVFRDSSAWYHIVFVWDTTQSTASNRIKCYVNGEQISFSIAAGSGYPALNHDGEINNTSELTLGSLNTFAGYYLDGYLAELHFIDGQALTPASFGETNEDTNQWQAIKYAGSYGTNGFYLKFQDSAALGDDSSGNTNDFSATNLVATDQVLDSPTNNFATLNPIFVSSMSNDGSTYSEGNLKVNDASSYYFVATGTQATPTSGKWYFETIATELTATHSHSGAGWSNVDYLQSPSDGPANTSNGYQYSTDGQKVINSTASSFGDAWAVDDVIGFALDLDNGFIYAAKNNTWQNSGDPTSGATGTGALGTSLSGNFIPFGYDGSSSVGLTEVFNFGQDSSFAGAKTAQGNTDGNSIGDFYYTPPSGYLALCTDNLSDPSIADPTAHFNTVLWSGDGTSSRSITGVGFTPGLSWGKSRGGAYDHQLIDSVRGDDKILRSNSTGEELAHSSLGAGGFSTLDSDGFTIVGNTSNDNLNKSSTNSVAWNFLAGGTAVSNTDGTDITSSVSANSTAGFSIVKWTGTGATDDSVGHGLSQAPELIIVKNIEDAGNDWATWHDSFPVQSVIYLNTTGAAALGGESGRFDTLPTASVFTPGNAANTNENTKDYIAYCFHGVEGYSKVGSYTGNGAADGPFIYTGMAPSFVIFKNVGAAENWRMIDNKRDPYNVRDRRLIPNSASEELGPDNGAGGQQSVDFLSNGFKLRTANSAQNQNATSIIYLAFAESPFKTSNAR